MTVFKLYFDKDKETAWLNEMSANGWKLTGFFLGFYTFVPCEKGEYIYQLDFYERNKNGEESYDAFMNEMGITVVCTWIFWVYLCKKAEDGPFELYTDVESQVAHYTKIRNMFKIGSALEFGCALVEIIASLGTGSSILVFAYILLCILGCVLAYEAYNTDNRIRSLKGLPARPQSDKKKIPLFCLLASSFLILSRRNLSPVFGTVMAFLAGAAVGLALVAVIVAFWEKKNQGGM